jgi:hypothetical protein
MTPVFLITRDALYRGDLNLRSPTGAPVRLLDALRSPQRIQEPGRATPSLTLAGAIRKPLGGGQPRQLQEPLTVGPWSVIAAYEADMEAHRSGEAVYEKRRRDESPELRVVLFLAGNVEAEAIVPAGRRALEQTRGDANFIATTDLKVRGTFTGWQDRYLSFLAVNTSFLEGYSIV